MSAPTLFADEKWALQKLWVNPGQHSPEDVKLARIVHRLAIEVERCHLLIAELSSRLEGGR